MDGQQVTVDLSGVPAGTEATFIFRLVNNDTDKETTVEITSFELLAGAGQGQPSVDLRGCRFRGVERHRLRHLVGYLGQRGVGVRDTSFDEQAMTLFSDAAVVNQGQYLADAPLVLVIDNVSDPTVHAADFDGRTPDGLPYYDFTSLMDDGTLEPRASRRSRGRLPFGIPRACNLTLIRSFWPS